MKIYIAGPMTGYKDWNFDSFKHTEDILDIYDFKVENPVNNGSDTSLSWEWYLKKALTQMLTCDAVLLLKGWEKSKGARLEFNTATAVGIPCFVNIDDLVEYRDEA